MAMATAFAPAERALQEEIERQSGKLAAIPFVREFLDAVPNMSVILNKQRQIVFANQSFADFVKATDPTALLGKSGLEAVNCQHPGVLGRRPGEAVRCIRSNLTEGGCGTTPFCRTCGTVIAILNSQREHMLNIQECRMIRGRPGVEETALDLRVWSRPIEVEGETFSVFSMVDISDEKRREALERIFFHDVLNTAGGVKGLADLMVQVGMPESGIREVAGMVAESADRLLDEISAQCALSAAESRELQVTAETLHSPALLNQMTRHFHSYCLAASKTIQVDPMASEVTLVSDAVLLQRVLMNLAKNALEATPAGGTVTIGAHAEGDLVSFTVHNATVMSQDVQSQVFARSFSTKGSGRGLGTYSIKLITERYLGGKVSFVSTAKIGTRFTVSYPRTIPSSLAGSPRDG